MSGLNVELVNVKLVVHIVTAWFLTFKFILLWVNFVVHPISFPEYGKTRLYSEGIVHNLCANSSRPNHTVSYAIYT